MRVILVVVALAASSFALGPAPAVADLPPAASGADAYRHVGTYGTHPGLHRTGTPGGRATADWIASELTGYGLDVTYEPFTFRRYAPAQVSLAVGGFRPETFPFYYSGFTSPEGVTAELVDVGLGTPLDFARADVAGKIALVDVPAVQNALVPSFEPAMSAAREAGAVAVVASIRGALNRVAAQNADERGGLCDLPTVIVGKVDGQELRLRDGRPAHLTLSGQYEDGEDGSPIGKTGNVVATLPGTTNDVIVVGTPYNGWFSAAGERGTGVGTMLTLARHFASAGPLPQTMVFLATAGHEIGFLGLERFIDDHPDLVQRTTAYVHLGATLAAKQQKEVAGEVVDTGLPEETRVLFTSENPLLVSSAERAMRTNPVGPMGSVPPGVLNPGEQQFMYSAGVPIVSISGGSLWFHTAGDEPYTTSAELLDPVVTAFRQILEDVQAMPRDTVRAANVLAEALARDSEDRGDAVQRCE